jgi:hypothetical protein
VRIFALAYLGLMLVDAVLSAADTLIPSNLHLSKWTTVALCLASAFVFIAAAIAALVVRFRPRWPLLLSSGAYSLYFGTLLASAFLGLQGDRTPAAQHAWNLGVAGVQLLLAVMCLAGLLLAQRVVSNTVSRPGYVS